MRAAWLVALALMTLASGAYAAQRRAYDYEPVVVELTGRIVWEMHYGPPNYGDDPKHDRQGNYPILKLDRPIDVRGDPKDEVNSEAHRGVDRIQLVVTDGRPRFRGLIGKPVKVRGALFNAHLGHHYTPVLLTVQKVSPIK